MLFLNRLGGDFELMVNDSLGVGGLVRDKGIGEVGKLGEGDLDEDESVFTRVLRDWVGLIDEMLFGFIFDDNICCLASGIYSVHVL